MNGEDSLKWNNWEWQRDNSISEINSITGLSKEIAQSIGNSYRMLVTPYYYKLINFSNDFCPIKAQVIPSAKELIPFDNCNEYNLCDSLAEKEYMPIENLVHRYPDRVLITVTNQCFSYCRFCTRKRLTANNSEFKFDFRRIIEYIKNNKQVRDVLISGGDPLILQNDELENMIFDLRKIEHVEIIRIGTRAPVVLPMRITEQLVHMLKKYHPIWINTHFNHPAEITAEAMEACARIIDAGIPLGNQSVLLKDINDDPGTYKNLCLLLVKNRIRPYYLYQCDLGIGNQHFISSIDNGIKIINSLRGFTTGFAVPTFVVDAPNGGGKIPISNNNIVDIDSKHVFLKNYEGKIYTYPIITTKVKGD